MTNPYPDPDPNGNANANANPSPYPNPIPNPDQLSCDGCEAGTYCEAGANAQTRCKAGYYP